MIPSAENINAAHAMALRCAKDAVQHAIRCGELLRAQKAALPHGKFMAWVEANCVIRGTQERSSQ